MKITTKGQVTIPQEIRERLGLLPHTKVEFEVRDDVVVLKKANVGRRGGRIVEHMRGRECHARRQQHSARCPDGRPGVVFLVRGRSREASGEV